MQIAAERNHGDHVKVTQMVEQAMQLVDRHGLVEQHLVGLSIDHVRTVKGHQQATVALKIELLRQGMKAPRGTARGQNELNARLLRCEQFLARARANYLLVIGERTVDIHCDGLDCHICLPVIERPCLSHHTEHPRRRCLQREKCHIVPNMNGAPSTIAMPVEAPPDTFHPIQIARARIPTDTGPCVFAANPTCGERGRTR